MPFDSFMTACLVHELSERLTGIKVDKVCQPERDEIDLLFNVSGRSRLVINCTSSTPYMALSSEPRENPSQPPMMCMLLRKHLSRAKITSVRQPRFDRIIEVAFEGGDELGFRKAKYLYCEMMGRGSNLIFADEERKILAAFRQNDITTKFGRVVMVGFPYEEMPPQDKIDPIAATKEEFLGVFQAVEKSSRCDSVLQKRFGGFGKLTSSEIVFRAFGDAETTVERADLELLWNSFTEVMDMVRNQSYRPCVIYQSREDFLEGKNPLDFSFMEIKQFGSDYFVHFTESASECIETYYRQRNFEERQKQHYNDIYQLLKNCRSRLERKIAAQRLQLADAEDFEKDKHLGDLIMQELYRIRRGDESVEVTDYTEEGERKIVVPLDKTLSPSGNAQHYYREYAKKKTALVKMEEQIALAEGEIDYCDSVLATLSTSSTASDLQQIRLELSHWSYGRRLVSGLKKPQMKKEKAKPKEYRSPGGFSVFVGMNNLQNDYVSTNLADKNDVWFHVKNYHGSHVLLKAMEGREFGDEDYEFAASLAAAFSEVKESDRVDVDYTRAKFIKKPAASKPGFITYKNHYTMAISPQKYMQKA